MRIDKFLNISCIFKTRSAAEKAIEKNLVMLNGKAVKPAHKVNVGDELLIINPLKKSTYRIEMLCEKNVSKKQAEEMISLIKEEDNEF